MNARHADPGGAQQDVQGRREIRQTDLAWSSRGEYLSADPGSLQVHGIEFDAITLMADIVGDDRFLLVDQLLEIQIHAFNGKQIGLVSTDHIEIAVARRGARPARTAIRRAAA